MRKSMLHLTFLTLGLVSIAPATIGNALALSCGDTITANTGLTADLGPCSGPGLTIGANSVTLSLNGFSILGSMDGSTGVNMRNTANVTVKGPGTISGFGWGVDAGDIDGARILRVHFVGNSSVAVGLGRVVGSTIPSKITNNTFDDNPCLGILISDYNDTTNAVQVTGNVISGSSAPTDDASCNSAIGGGVGIWLTTYGVVVRQNTVTGNTNGLFADGYSYGLVASGNDFSSNSQDGIVSLSASTIRANHVNSNGRDGISVTGGESMIQNNMANGNGRRGIGVGDVLSIPSGSDITVTTNRALGNVTDLFWDGVGTSDCWTGNVFVTSSGALPSCP